MAFSTVTVYEGKGQTTAVIPPAGDVSECDYSDSEDEETKNMFQCQIMRVILPMIPLVMKMTSIQMIKLISNNPPAAHQFQEKRENNQKPNING